MRRLILQTILTLPAFMLAPIGWLFSLGGGGALTEKLYFVACSFVGLLSLFVSILNPARSGSGRWIVMIGLIIGIQLDIYIFSNVKFDDWIQWVISPYPLGGPLAVGIWNLILLLQNNKTEPNQSLQTIRFAVTSRAPSRTSRASEPNV